MRTSTEPITPWSARIGTVLFHQRTLVALLVLAWVAEVAMLLAYDHESVAIIAPTNTLAVLVALFARRYPVASAVGLAVVLMATIVPCQFFDETPATIGLNTPTESAAVLLVVSHLLWSRPLRSAGTLVVGLAGVCVVASTLRSGDFHEQYIAITGLEFVLFAGSVLYLRYQQSNLPDTPLRELLSKQWPTIAALSIVLFVQVINLGGDSGIVLLLCSLVVAGLAVLAPLRPVETAMLGALTLILTTIMIRVFGLSDGSFITAGIPPVTLAGNMILMAHAARLSAPRRAIYSVAALVVSWLFALLVLGRLSQLPNSIAMVGLLGILAVGTGLYFRARDRDRTKSVQSAVTQAQQSERMALARELHDVVAHHVTGIVVHAQAAHMVAAKNPEVAAQALERISHSGTEALTAMRRLVGSMRGAETAGSSGAAEQATTDLRADLEALVERSNQLDIEHGSAPRLELDVRLEEDIPHEVARSALRLAQESLTNAQKHALDASVIQIAVATSRRHLNMRITDDGAGRRSQPVGGSGGYGLVGMRERVELLGGQFKAGPGDHVGWRVEAWLPLENDEDEAERQRAGATTTGTSRDQQDTSATTR